MSIKLTAGYVVVKGPFFTFSKDENMLFASEYIYTSFEANVIYCLDYLESALRYDLRAG